MDKIATADIKGRVTGLEPKKRYYVQTDSGGGVHFQPVPEKDPVEVRDICKEEFARLLGLEARDIVGDGGVTLGPLPPKYRGEANFGLTVEVFLRNDAGERTMNYVSNSLNTEIHLIRLV